MQTANRDLNRVWSALFEKRHYIAAKNMLSVYEQPFDAYYRYLCGAGEYPASIQVKTPCGPIQLMLYSPDDMLTVNEIFCREDYKVHPAAEIIVDFGSNIGLSAAYFLSRNLVSRAYLFEPVPRNVRRLEINLRPFAGRFEVSRVAVAPSSGVVQFGCEPTGRYGGVGKMTGETMEVEAVAAKEILKAILARHGRIDLLKIDIETLEQHVVESLSDEVAEHIETCLVEYPFAYNPLRKTHEMSRYGPVARFRRLARAG